MKRKQLLATMLAAAMLTSTVLSPAGNVTVRAMEMESIHTEEESVSEETQDMETETELVSEDVQEVERKNITLGFSDTVKSVTIAEDDWKTIWAYLRADTVGKSIINVLGENSGGYIDEGDDTLWDFSFYGMRFSRNSEDELKIDAYEQLNRIVEVTRTDTRWDFETLGKDIIDAVANGKIPAYDMYFIKYDYSTDEADRWAAFAFMMDGKENDTVLKFADESNEESVLVIPEGTTFIREGEFRGNTEITKVVIPESVTTIWHGAFRDCSKLAEVEFSGNLTRIGVGAFSGTAWLENLKKENDLVIVNHCLIDGKNAAGEVVIPEGVKVIAEGAFANNDNITKVIVPEGVTSLGLEVFSGCDNLEEVILPSTITEIDGDGGQWWGAFQDCTGLKKITIPEGVTEIDYYLFSDCTNLSEIKIPSTVTKIKMDAFLGCSSLTDIYYAGTEAEWNQIEKSEANIPSTAAIHYESEASNEGADDSQKVILNDAEGIPDAKLYKIVLETADTNKDGTLTAEEAATIKNLSAVYDISDLKGIEYCTSLEELHLTNTKVSNISALSKLTNLITLNLAHNKITDISALSELTNLTNINLSDNQITDVSALSKLTNLTTLNLDWNQITDVSPLADLVLNHKLTDFSFLGNNVTEIGDFPTYVI